MAKAIAKRVPKMRAKGTRHRSYAAAVDFLTKHPDKIEEAWEDPFEAKGGSLFVFVSENGHASIDYESPSSNSDTCRLDELKLRRRNTIKGIQGSLSRELLADLKADKRIPMRQEYITVERGSLIAYAEWQERLDRAFEKCKDFPRGSRWTNC